MKNLFQISFLFVIFILPGCSEQSEIKLVNKGKSDYSILIDPNAPESLCAAAQELQSYFMKVTGASPEIVVTNKPVSIPCISLGTTSALIASGMDTSDIPNDGFRIVTKDKNIFIIV